MKKLLNFKLKYTVGLRKECQNVNKTAEQIAKTIFFSRVKYSHYNGFSPSEYMTEFTVTLRQHGVGQLVGDLSTLKGGGAANKFRKSQIRIFQDLNNLLNSQTFFKCGTCYSNMRFVDTVFFVICGFVICGFAT
jgi:hypothetical protein